MKGSSFSIISSSKVSSCSSSKYSSFNISLSSIAFLIFCLSITTLCCLLFLNLSYIFLPVLPTLLPINETLFIKFIMESEKRTIVIIIVNGINTTKAPAFSIYFCKTRLNPPPSKPPEGFCLCESISCLTVSKKSSWEASNEIVCISDDIIMIKRVNRKVFLKVKTCRSVPLNRHHAKYHIRPRIRKEATCPKKPNKNPLMRTPTIPTLSIYERNINKPVANRTIDTISRCSVLLLLTLAVLPFCDFFFCDDELAKNLTPNYYSIIILSFMPTICNIQLFRTQYYRLELLTLQCFQYCTFNE